jgi:hypothetical protein
MTKKKYGSALIVVSDSGVLPNVESLDESLPQRSSHRQELRPPHQMHFRALRKLQTVTGITGRNEADHCGTDGQRITFKYGR